MYIQGPNRQKKNNKKEYKAEQYTYSPWTLGTQMQASLLSCMNLFHTTNRHRHRQSLSLKDVGSPIYSFPMFSILGSSQGTFQVQIEMR